MKLIVFSPCFVCVRWIPSFCSISLPSRFTVLCGTTSISQSFATEFPDERCILSVLIILILLLLKHRNSPSLGVLFCIYFPSLFIRLFAVCCDMKLLGLPVSTSQCILHFPDWVSNQYSPIWVLFILLTCVCFQSHLTRLIVFQSSIISLM